MKRRCNSLSFDFSWFYAFSVLSQFSMQTSQFHSQIFSKTNFHSQFFAFPVFHHWKVSFSVWLSCFHHFGNVRENKFHFRVFLLSNWIFIRHATLWRSSPTSSRRNLHPWSGMSRTLDSFLLLACCFHNQRQCWIIESFIEWANKLNIRNICRQWTKWKIS